MRVWFPALVIAMGIGGCADCLEAGGTNETERLADAASVEARRLARRCDQGSTRHCWFLGHLYAGAMGFPRDVDHALELYARSCGADGVEGCVDLGEAARVEDRHEEALELFRTGCAGRRLAACLAAMRSADANSQPFLDETLHACRAGRVESCHALARAVDDVLPAPAGSPSEESRLGSDAERELRWTAMRCDRKAATMCAALADFYLAEPSPRGITRDVEHAGALAGRACSDENVTGCVVLGRLALERGGMAQAEASIGFERACESGVLAGCAALVDQIQPMDSDSLARQSDARLELCFTTADEGRCAAARALFESPSRGSR